MKNRKNQWTTFALLLVAVTLVVACQGAAPAPTQPPAPAPTQPPAQAQAVNLDFAIWTFAADMVQDNINKFQATAPGVTVKLVDYNWGQYHDTLVTNFSSGSAVPDVLYGSDSWVQEWAKADWIVPLKQVCPEDQLNALAKDMFPYSTAGETINGDLYGLPYYADPIAFSYNTRIYKAAGITRDPQTWDDVLNDARAIKKAGLVKYPIGFGWSQQEPFSIETTTALLMSRGDEFFDDNLEPTFLKPNSTLEQHINWVKTALQEGLMDPETLTRDGVADGQAVMAGTQVYGMTRASGLAQWQDPKSSKEAGNFKMILMPGPTHQTLGFVRYYAVSKKLAGRDQAAKDAACKFLNYFAGPGPANNWPVVKRWALEQGLGFGPIPLYQDPDIRAAFGKWTDVAQLEQIANGARARKLTPYYASWDVFTRAELQRAYLGQTPVDQAMKNIAAKWNELKAQ